MTDGEWKLKVAELALTAKLGAVLDSTYAAAAARERAKFVTVSDDGTVDGGALTIQYAEALREAPPKMRNDYQATRATDAEFYNNLRAAVAKRHEAASTGGTAELVKRMGS